jgi:hypothetical protein
MAAACRRSCSSDDVPYLFWFIAFFFVALVASCVVF